MNSYVTFMFYMYMLNIAIYLGHLMISRYPRKEKVSMGLDVARVLVGIGMLTWICVLKFYGGGA